MTVNTLIDLTPLLGGKPIGVTEAATLFPGSRGASHASKHTVIRRITKGTLINGTRVRLGGVRIGGNWHTSAEAIAEYILACNETPAAALPPSSAASRRAANKAEAELIRLGC